MSEKIYDNSKSWKMEVDSEGYVCCRVGHSSVRLDPRYHYKYRLSLIRHVCDKLHLKMPSLYATTVRPDCVADIYDLSLSPVVPLPSKEYNKVLCDFVGGSASALFKWYSKLYIKQYLVPFAGMKGYFYKTYHIFDNERLYNAFQIKDIVLQAWKDKQYNIIPLIIAFKAPPSSLKKKFGNSVWKKLCTNSKYRNQKLSYHEDFLIPELIDIPTTLLERYLSFGDDSKKVAYLKYLKNNFKGSWSKPEKLVTQAYLFSDTFRMAQQLEQPFNPEWTPRRLQEEHDRFITLQRITRRPDEHTKEPFEFSVAWPDYIKFGGYTAHLLKSPLEIAEEGDYMGHCVASYIGMVASGQYIVYSVRKDGKRSSTLGLSAVTTAMPARGLVEFNQHYARFNQIVVDPSEHDIAYVITEACKDVLKAKKTPDLMIFDEVTEDDEMCLAAY
jgi:hypothetical protein